MTQLLSKREAKKLAHSLVMSAVNFTLFHGWVSDELEARGIETKEFSELVTEYMKDIRDFHHAKSIGLKLPERNNQITTD